MPLLRKERIWPAIVIAVLVVDVGVGVVMMRVANDDPNFAVEPDYYQKAVAWDSTVAQATRNRALGWTLTPVLGPLGARRPAPLAMLVHDASGAPVGGAVVEVEAIPVAHASDPVLATLLPGDAPGAYSAPVPMNEPGIWELRVTATRGTDRFTEDLRLDTSTSDTARVIRDRPWEAIPERLRAGTRPEPGRRTPGS